MTASIHKKIKLGRYVVLLKLYYPKRNAYYVDGIEMKTIFVQRSWISQLVSAGTHLDEDQLGESAVLHCYAAG